MDGVVDSPLAAMLVVGGALAVGMILAWVVASLLGRVARSVRRDISRARGADRPAWAPGIWHCAACLTTNHPAATRCVTCREPRRELAHASVEARPDWIPERIAAAGGEIVTLVHDAAAHTDPGEAHWRLTVGGRTVGSTARRDGALELLRALDGIEIVALDVRGTGPARYRRADVIARFEGPRFPLDVPCPERGP